MPKIRKRRIKRGTKTTIFTLSKMDGNTMLPCRVCGTFTTCSADAASVECAVCVCRSIPLAVTKIKTVKPAKAPKLNKNGKPRAKRGEGVKYAPSGFPRGWHFKKLYIHTDGKKYSRGKLVS